MITEYIKLDNIKRIFPTDGMISLTGIKEMFISDLELGNIKILICFVTQDPNKNKQFLISQKDTVISYVFNKEIDRKPTREFDFVYFKTENEDDIIDEASFILSLHSRYL